MRQKSDMISEKGSDMTSTDRLQMILTKISDAGANISTQLDTQTRQIQNIDDNVSETRDYVRESRGLLRSLESTITLRVASFTEKFRRARRHSNTFTPDSNQTTATETLEEDPILKRVTDLKKMALNIS